MTSEISSETSSAVSRHPCVTCQRRKVRCDRNNPCTRCLRSGQECKQPEAFRAPRRPPRKQQANVLDRVRQLEDSLEQVRHLVSHVPQVKAKSDEVGGGVEVRVEEVEIKQEKVEDSLGRLIIEEERSRYVSGSAWANLANQVGDLRTLLEDDGANDEDNSGNPTQYLIDGMFSSSGNAVKMTYSQIGLSFLWQTYTRYVDPVMKVFHIPSMQIVIDNLLSDSSPPSRSMEALVAAIKYGAVTTMSDEDCWEQFSTSREILIAIFKSEVQATLSAANFLLSHDLTTLQAFLIFLASVAVTFPNDNLAD